MSNIDSNIVDPARDVPMPPDSIVPDSDGDHVGSDAVQEPDDYALPIEPDPEERGPPGGIERA